MEHVRIVFTYISELWQLAPIVFLCAALSFLSYLRFLRSPLRLRIVPLCFLRFLALLTAVVLLLRPLVRFQSIEKQNRRLAVLIDASRSMSIRDGVAGSGRFEEAVRFASSEIMEELGRAFDLRFYTFSTSLSPRSGGEVPEGEWTSLFSAVKNAGRGEPPLAACVVFTDGCETEDQPPRGFPVPLWFVPVGSGRGVWNACVRSVRCEDVVIAGNETLIRAEVGAYGSIPPERIEVVLNVGDTEVARKPLRLREGLQRVAFTLKVRTPGEVAGRVSISAPGGQAFTDDDSWRFFLTVVKEKIGVLFVMRRPRWAGTFAARSLEEDANIRLCVVVRTANGQITVRGEPPGRLLGLLPAELQEYRRLRAVVMDELTAGDATGEQLQALLSFVREGGGLIVLAGASEPGKGALPVPLLPASVSGPMRRGSFAVRPVSVDHPVLRGLLPFFSADPPFTVRTLVPLGGLRPGAEVVLAARDKEEILPLVVVQNFGAGRVAMVATGDTWGWVLREGRRGGKTLHDRLWGQLVRWAAGRERPRDGGLIEISRRVLSAGEELVIRPGGGKGRRLSVVIKDPAGKLRSFELGGRKHKTEIRLRPDKLGRWEVSCSAGRVSEKRDFFVEANPVERERLVPDRELLGRLAKLSGGGVVELPDLPTLGRRVVRSFPGIVVEKEVSPEKNPLLFLVFVFLVCLEWALRRRFFTI